MNTSALLQHQGQRLLQLGMALFLFSSLDGFAIPLLASPRIGLSVHTLSALQAVMLLAIGLVWPRLKLSPRAAKVAFPMLNPKAPPKRQPERRPRWEGSS